LCYKCFILRVSNDNLYIYVHIYIIIVMSWRNTYFLPEEVSSHNTRSDCWMTIYGVVKNVSGLIEEFGHDVDLVNPILREGGKDVSYWFEMNELGAIIVSTVTFWHLYLLSTTFYNKLPSKWIDFYKYCRSDSDSCSNIYYQFDLYKKKFVSHSFNTRFSS